MHSSGSRDWSDGAGSGGSGRPWEDLGGHESGMDMPARSWGRDSGRGSCGDWVTNRQRDGHGSSTSDQDWRAGSRMENREGWGCGGDCSSSSSSADGSYGYESDWDSAWKEWQQRKNSGRNRSSSSTGGEIGRGHDTSALDYDRLASTIGAAWAPAGGYNISR